MTYHSIARLLHDIDEVNHTDVVVSAIYTSYNIALNLYGSCKELHTVNCRLEITSAVNSSAVRTRMTAVIIYLL